MSEEMTNGKLSRFITLEFILTLLVVVGSIGISYGILSAKQAIADTRQEKVEKRLDSLTTSVTSIQRDTAVMATEQRYIKENLSEQKSDIKRILHLLERINVGTSDNR